MRKRVVVTGLGCISPLANNVDETWEALLAGKSGAAYITHFDASYHKTKFAAEVKGFDGVALFGAREARRMDRFTQFAMATTLEALAHANFSIDESNRYLLFPLPRQNRSANQLRATGSPDHKVCGQDDTPGRICSVFQDVDEHLNSQYTRLLNRLPDGGQRWTRRRGLGRIVKAHEGYLVRYAFACLAQGPQCTQGHSI